MTIETTCPACGAPLEFSGPQDEVRCTFCGAALQISQEDGQAHFQVISQPEPQKETLSKPVEPVQPEGTAQVYPAYSEPEAAAPQPPAPANWSLLDSAGQPAVYAAPEAPKRSSGANRWLIIGFSVLMGLLLTCACMAFVLTALFRAR